MKRLAFSFFVLNILCLFCLILSILLQWSVFTQFGIIVFLFVGCMWLFICLIKTEKKLKTIQLHNENKTAGNDFSQPIETNTATQDLILDLQTSQVSEEEHEQDSQNIGHALHKLDTEIFNFANQAFFSSIITYLNSTSEPMSESLVKIKMSIAEFLDAIKDQKQSYEGEGESTSLKIGIEAMRSHISEVTSASAQSCTDVSKEIKVLETQMSAILDLVANISDVAERIHVLSINASIEAARAGVQGKGFKIIADEVQRLSRETQTFVDTIGITVSGTKNAFNSLYSYMEKNQKMTEKYVQEDQTTYNEISKKVDAQIETVLTMYEAVLTFIESLQIDINVFSPLGMLHAIIIQEIENLERITKDYVQLSVSVSVDKKLSEEEKNEKIYENIERIRKRLTTSRELHALSHSLDKAGIAHNVDLKKVDTEIEFY